MAKPEWMPQGLYQWSKPRSLGLHALYLLIGGGCLIAMWWQVHRAMEGNILSYLYSVEWPVIAIVVGIGWWQLVHDTPEDIARRHEYHVRMRAASAEVVARTLPRSARALTVASEEVTGRALGTAGAGTRAIPATSSRAIGGTPGGIPGASAVVPVGAPLARADGGDPFDDRLLDPDDGLDGGAEDEMTEYNRYLAALAIKGRPKTWRNPRGL
jgi:hypothetical protein